MLMASSLAAIAPAATVAAATTAAAIATAAAAAAVSASAAPTPTRRTGFSGPGLIHGQRTAFHGLAIEFGDGILSVLLGTHRHKSKAARFAGEFVLHERHFLDRAGL